MFGLGTTELMIIVVIVMVIFGAGKLPQIGSSLGAGIRNFRKGVSEEAESDSAKEPEIVS